MNVLDKIDDILGPYYGKCAVLKWRGSDADVFIFKWSAMGKNLQEDIIQKHLQGVDEFFKKQGMTRWTEKFLPVALMGTSIPPEITIDLSQPCEGIFLVGVEPTGANYNLASYTHSKKDIIDVDHSEKNFIPVFYVESKKQRELRPEEDLGRWLLWPSSVKVPAVITVAYGGKIEAKKTDEKNRTPDASFYHMTGAAQLKKGEYAKAIASFKKYLDMSPKSAWNQKMRRDAEKKISLASKMLKNPNHKS